jgi:WD40 repeat protein
MKTITMHDLRTLKIIQHYEAHPSSVNDIAVHPDGNYMVSVSGNN